MKYHLTVLLFLVMMFNAVAQNISIVVYEGKVSFVDKKQSLLPKTRYEISSTTIIDYEPGSKFTIFSKNKLFHKKSKDGASLNYQKILQNLNASIPTGFLKLMSTYRELSEMETLGKGSAAGAAKGLNDKKDIEPLESGESISPIDSAKTSSNTIHLNWKLKNSIMNGRMYIIHQITQDTLYNQPANNIGSLSINLEKLGQYDWFIYSKSDKKKRINRSFIKLSEEEASKIRTDFEAFKTGIAMLEDDLKDFLIEEYKLKFGMIE